MTVHGHVFWLSEPWPADLVWRSSNLGPAFSQWACLETTELLAEYHHWTRSWPWCCDSTSWLDVRSASVQWTCVVIWNISSAWLPHRPPLLFLVGCCGTSPLPQRPRCMPCCLLVSLTEQTTLASPWTQNLISGCCNTYLVNAFKTGLSRVIQKIWNRTVTETQVSCVSLSCSSHDSNLPHRNI